MKPLQPNELRLNNYLYFLGNVVQVKGIDGSLSREYIQTEDYIPSKIIHFKGIPLDEQWLENFGFKYDQITYYKDSILCAWVKSEFVVWYRSFGESGKILNKIKYVHQLQNLYFSLTGSELKIKE